MSLLDSIPPPQEKPLIKANELRTGNLLQGKPLSIPREGIYSNGISTITAYGIHLIESGVEQLGTLQPIPLTIEILKKCGFKIIAGWACDHYSFNNVVIMNCAGTGLRYSQSNVELKYVHQLQNLFYALTGEELEVEL